MTTNKKDCQVGIRHKIQQVNTDLPDLDNLVFVVNSTNNIDDSLFEEHASIT